MDVGIYHTGKGGCISNSLPSDQFLFTGTKKHKKFFHEV